MVPAAAPLVKDLPMPFVSQLDSRERTVTLAALADVSTLPAGLRAKVAALPILKIPDGRQEMRVSSRRLRARAGVLAPALKPWLTGEDHPVLIRYARAAQPAQAFSPCVSVQEAIPAGAPPTSRSFAPASCAGAVDQALWFDARAGVVRARRALRPGEVVQKPPASAMAGVAPGDPLLIEARVGPVRVQRHVVALQPAHPGDRLFAKTADGSVISIPYPSPDQ